MFAFPQPPCLMGIVNITPDSFSDGGAFLDPAAAAAHGRELAAQGARILDLGAEASSFFRPGVVPVSAEELGGRRGAIGGHTRGASGAGGGAGGGGDHQRHLRRFA